MAKPVARVRRHKPHNLFYRIHAGTLVEKTAWRLPHGVLGFSAHRIATYHMPVPRATNQALGPVPRDSLRAQHDATMMEADHDLISDFVVESLEHLADTERQLLEIEASAPQINVDLVNTVFRAVHSTKGAAGFLGLHTINSLAHHLENVLNQMRNRELIPNPAIIDVLLRSVDCLRSLLNQVEHSNDVDVSAFIEALRQISEKHQATPPATSVEIESVSTALPPGRAVGCREGAGGVGGCSETAQSPKVDEPYAEPARHESPSMPQLSKSQPPQPASQATPTTSPAAVPTPATENAAQSNAAASHAADTSIRVSVNILDHLMNLAGELVLGRNQLLQVLESKDRTALETVGNRIDQVTSELQATVMRSRMQPIGNVFSRFTRVVRDLSAQLGKQCELIIEGKEVELDKTIVEAIGDPLTHLIRNSLDHGLEKPDKRVANGKRPSGTIILKAAHQAGRVSITIQDDGAGIDGEKVKAKALAKGLLTPEQAAAMSAREAVRLIFLPGFSTAETVTDVSGRGVGMDVVKTNIAKLGGTVDIETEVGRGTIVDVKLPLTLAIIPSLIVRCGSERFAIPQSSISELVRVRAGEVAKRVERVKNAEVLRLRGHLLPLLRLSDVLGVAQSVEPANEQGRGKNGLSIIVVETGRLRYGLIVDGLHDSEEIVVKPLGRHLKNCSCLAGATVLGDGRVALILDIGGIGEHAKLEKPADRDIRDQLDETASQNAETQSVLLFTNDPSEHFAVPMSQVKRIERVTADQIHTVGGRPILQYRNSSLPLLQIEGHINARPRPELKRLYVVVFTMNGMEIGLIVPRIVDIRQISTNIDTVQFREPGILGSLVVDQKTVRVLDAYTLATLAHPEWQKQDSDAKSKRGAGSRILVVEDSSFFRKQVTGFLNSQGYETVECEDGQAAWDRLHEEDSFDLVVTDIEMPRMNGFELCRRIKDHPALQYLPVIALTSLAGQEDVERGAKAGIDDYQVKMDRDKLLAAVARLLSISFRPTETRSMEVAGS